MTAAVRPAPRRGVWEVPFWQHVEGKRLHLQRCDACEHVWYPPGPACPWCLSTAWIWTAMAGSGELLSWVTFHRQYFLTIPPPYTVAAVALDEGPIIIADTGADTGADPGGLAIGDRMHLVYRAVEDEDGEPFTLYGWEPDPTRTGAAN